MSDRTLHIPQDFAARDEVRLFARAMSESWKEKSQREAMGVAMGVATGAQIIVLSLWMAWARSGKAHRPYRNAAAAPGQWTDPLVTLVMEEIALWLPGIMLEHVAEMMGMLTVAGVLVEEVLDGRLGLTLTGFAEHNEHLHPDYKSLQRRGKEGQNRSRELARVAAAAPDARKYLEQAAFAFPTENPPTPEEKEAALSLILQVHAALDLPMPATAADWSPIIFRDALGIIRTYSPNSIAKVTLHVWEQLRGSTNTEPADILRNFASIFGRLA